jgi:hypothetical protein
MQASGQHQLYPRERAPLSIWRAQSRTERFWRGENVSSLPKFNPRKFSPLLVATPTTLSRHPVAQVSVNFLLILYLCVTLNLA